MNVFTETFNLQFHELYFRTSKEAKAAPDQKNKGKKELEPGLKQGAKAKARAAGNEQGKAKAKNNKVANAKAKSGEMMSADLDVKKTSKAKKGQRANKQEARAGSPDIKKKMAQGKKKSNAKSKPGGSGGKAAPQTMSADGDEPESTLLTTNQPATKPKIQADAEYTPDADKAKVVAITRENKTDENVKPDDKGIDEKSGEDKEGEKKHAVHGQDNEDDPLDDDEKKDDESKADGEEMSAVGGEKPEETGLAGDKNNATNADTKTESYELGSADAKENATAATMLAGARSNKDDQINNSKNSTVNDKDKGEPNPESKENNTTSSDEKKNGEDTKKTDNVDEKTTEGEGVVDKGDGSDDHNEGEEEKEDQKEGDKKEET